MILCYNIGMGKRIRDIDSEVLCVDEHLHTGSFSAFRSVHLSTFVFAFFGIGFYRLWYQFNFYNLHFSVDLGMVTVAANVVRAGVIFLLVLLVYRAGFTRAGRGVFVWSGFVLMTASSLLYLIDLFFDQTSFESLRIVIGGVGLVGGEVIWIFFLERLKPAQVFMYAAGGLALSCALSLAMGYLDPAVAGMVNLFVPALSVFSYWQAMSELDKRSEASERTGDALYESPGQFLGIVQIVAAFFLYALLLGVALGYPDGRLRELSQAARSVHQVLVVALLCAVVWFVLVRGRAFKLSGYWLFQNALMMASICFLMSGAPLAEEASTFLLTNAITCFYIPLVYFICLIARHVRWPATLVYAVVYGGSLLFMAGGRVVVYRIGPTLDHSLWLLIVMAVLVLVESTLVIRPKLMGDTVLGFEIDRIDARRLSPETFWASTPPIAQAGCGFAEAYGLTSVEGSIIRLIAQGRSRSFIADALNYSENTIRNYTRTAYRKVGVHSKQELIDRVVEFSGVPEETDG